MMLFLQPILNQFDVSLTLHLDTKHLWTLTPRPTRVLTKLTEKRRELSYCIVRMRVFIMHMDLEWSDILRYVLQLSDKEIAKRTKAVDMYMFWA